MEEILALDMLTLRAHTLAVGDEFTTERHRAALVAVLPKSKIVKIHRSATLAGYTYLWPKGGGLWFVGGVGIHPDFRFGRVIAQLLAEIKTLAEHEGITELQSHVYKTNQRSIALHQRLGFKFIQENQKGLAFSLKLADNANPLQSFPNTQKVAPSAKGATRRETTG
jgi:ribosomal protein S18 acetylase RimI-like enzyme